MVDQELYHLEHAGCAQRYGEAGVFAGSPPASRSGTGAAVLCDVWIRDPNGSSLLRGLRVTSSQPRLTLSEAGVLGDRGKRNFMPCGLEGTTAQAPLPFSPRGREGTFRFHFCRRRSPSLAA